MISYRIHRHGRGERGFSLLEMLVAISLIALLLGLCIPVVTDVLRSRGLAQGGISVMDAFNAAQQMASVSASPARVRFFSVVDPRNGDATAYRAIRLERFNPKGRRWEEFQKTQLLPIGVEMVVDQSEESSLLEIAPVENAALRFRGEEITAQIATVVFHSDGRVRLDPNQVYSLTLKNRHSTADFLTVQLDAVTGRTRIFRP